MKATMKTVQRAVIAASTMVACAIMPVSAQKGAGEEIGVARQVIQPELNQVSGTLDRIKVGPCKHTTGRAYIGTHLFLKQENGDIINLHLGPENSVKSFVDKLSIGDVIHSEAFRTENLKDGEYVARTVSSGNETFVLRDEYLRPIWAGETSRRSGRKFFNRQIRR